MGGVAASPEGAGVMASSGVVAWAAPGCSGSDDDGVTRSSGASGRLDESSQAAKSRAIPSTDSEQRMASPREWDHPRAQDKRRPGTESIRQNRELQQFGQRMQSQSTGALAQVTKASKTSELLDYIRCLRILQNTLFGIS